MHKHLVMLSVAALGLSAARGATAQVAIPKPSFGIIGGINVAKLSNVGDLTGDAMSVSNRTGFDGGLFVTLHFTQSFAIEPEVLYSQQGAKADDGEGDEGTLKVDYINIPVLLRFDLPSASTPIHPFIVAGPAASYQVKCDVSSAGVSGSCDDIFEGVAKKSFDYAAVGGAGVEFNLGGTALSVSGRYTYGFNEMFQNSSVKNRYWSILAGITF